MATLNCPLFKKEPHLKFSSIFQNTVSSSSVSYGLERSRSSGRLITGATTPTSEVGQLKRASAASTSALSRGVTGASSPTTNATTCATTGTTLQSPLLPAKATAGSAVSASTNLSTQIDQNGGGNKTRTRTIAEEKVGNGAECVGEATEIEVCNTDVCPGG